MSFHYQRQKSSVELLGNCPLEDRGLFFSECIWKKKFYKNSSKVEKAYFPLHSCQKEE